MCKELGVQVSLHIKLLMLLIVLIGLTSCGSDEKSPPLPALPTPLEQLQDKYDLYLSLQSDLLRDDCDGLLFRSLASVGGNSNINVMEHYKDPLWHRSPDNDCSNTTTISRDMIVGLLWWVWRTKNVEVASQLKQYAEEHALKMGEGDLRVYLTPQLYNTLFYIHKRLTGSNKDSTLPTIWDAGLDGYQAHIQMLHILLRAEIELYVQSKELEVIKAMYEREPDNALFAYAYSKFVSGNYDRLVAHLASMPQFPNDRLPTSQHRCTEWLWQRVSTSNDWKPCVDKQEAYSGGDFLFIAKLILDEIKP